MKIKAGLGALIALTATTTAASQALEGLRLGEPEAAAIVVLGPAHKSKLIKERPGASVLSNEHLSVTVCKGVISGLRASRPGNFLAYASLVGSEARRQGLSMTMVSHSSSLQDLALATTTWRQAGVLTEYQLAAIGKPGAAVEMIALEYRTDPDPCPKTGVDAGS